MPFQLTIALRYLFSRKKNNVINWITGISVFVVLVVAAALIIILSAMNGLSSSVMGLYSNFDPDLKITTSRGIRFNPDSVPLSEIEAINGVKYVSFSLEETALFKYEENQEVATIKGVTNAFAKVANIEESVIEGYYGVQENGLSESVLGINIAYKLGVMTDANIPLRIYIPNLEGNAVGPGEFFKSITTYPRGIFDINSDFNSKYVIVSMGQARHIINEPTNINSIEIALDSLAEVEEMQTKIQNILGNDFNVKTRFQQNEFLFKSINAEKWITLLILSLVIVLAIFNVIGSLTMLVIDKQKDIFVLQSMGANKTQIKFIFWLEGSLISVLGSLLGLFIGVILLLLQDKFCLFAYGTTSGTNCFPVELQFLDILIILMVINGIGSIASLIPIRKIRAIKAN